MNRDALWSGLEALAAAILSIVTSFVVARLIGPSELGIGAAVTAVHVLLWVVVNGLFADTVVQRATINDRVLSSAFWASVATGVAAMAVEAVAGWGLARMLDDSRLIPMALVLATTLPLVGAGSVIQGMLTRERAYARLALRTILGQGLGTAVGVSAALVGAGAWALVVQQTMTSACGAVVLLRGRGWTPARCLDGTAVRSLLAVGMPLTASTLVMIARYRLFAVLTGGCAGAAVLGQVHLAFRLVDTVRELVFTALWRLMLPTLAEQQRDRGRLLALVDRWVCFTLATVLPLCLALALGLARGIGLLMGPAWSAAGQAALPLVGLMALSALMFPGGVALMVAGQVRFALYANLAAMAIVCFGLVALRPDDPWQAVVIWTVSQILVIPYGLWANARALGVGMLRPLTGGFCIRALAW
jgi:O-antigen/teichoic acid export membrane protein